MNEHECPCTVGIMSTYRICVEGKLDERWADYFGCTITNVEYTESEQPLTTWTCEFADQAALFGALRRLNGLGLSLRLVEYIDN